MTKRKNKSVQAIAKLVLIKHLIAIVLTSLSALLNPKMYLVRTLHRQKKRVELYKNIIPVVLSFYKVEIGDNTMQEKKTLNIKINGTFLTLLGITFIILKLCGVIDWAWIWVLAPLWGGIALMLVIFLLFIILHIVIEVAYQMRTQRQVKRLRSYRRK